MKKILVTGASGFLGRHLIPLLKGYEVHAFSRAFNGPNFHAIDLFDFQKVDQWMESFKPEILIHLAWETTHGTFWHAKENLDWVKNSLFLFDSFVKNGGLSTLVSGTCYEVLNSMQDSKGYAHQEDCGTFYQEKNLTNSSETEDLVLQRKRASVEHVMNSFFLTKNNFPQNLDCGTQKQDKLKVEFTEEKTGCEKSYEQKKCSTLYGAAKKMLSIKASHYFKMMGIPFIWARVFYPYGPFENSKRLIPSLISALIEEKPFVVKTASHIRDFIFVEDVASAFYALLETQSEGFFDIGTGIGHSIGEACETLQNLMGKKNLIQFYSEPATSQNPEKLIANPFSLKKTGWVPKYSLEAGLQKTIECVSHALCH